MSAGFTPGPWDIGKHATPEHSPQFGIYAGAASRDHVIVKGDNAKADALLIAAAPVMFKALEKAKQRIEQLCSTVNALSNAQGLGDKVRAQHFTDCIEQALKEAVQS